MNAKWLRLLISTAILELLFLVLIPPQVVSANTSHCGDITTDETWSSDGNVHIIDCNVNVGIGVTLTITEGTIIKFDSGTSLIINGTLNVQGSESQPVYLTSYRDDSIGGDTNGDGVTTGQRGDWFRIEFTEFSSNASIIDYAIIRYGGHDSYYHSSDYGAITLFNASPTIQNADINESSYAGIFATSSSPDLGCNNIYNNKYGVFNDTPDLIFNAEGQWWGTSSGPYHPITNQSGAGNEVTDGVDFIPWATQPCWQPPTTQIQTFIPIIVK
jgi:hypothetical protein